MKGTSRNSRKGISALTLSLGLIVALGATPTCAFATSFQGDATPMTLASTRKSTTSTTRSKAKTGKAAKQKKLKKNTAQFISEDDGTAIYHIDINSEETGALTESVEANQYQFTLPSAGCVQLKSTMNLKGIHLAIYDAEGEKVWSDSNVWANKVTERIDYDESIQLTKGDYILEYYSSVYTGDYSFMLRFESAKESFPEDQNGSDNEFDLASPIKTGTTYKGQLAENDQDDNYLFTVSKAGDVRLNGTFNLEGVHIKVYDTSGDEVWSDWNVQANKVTGRIDYDESMTLSPGTYCLHIFSTVYTGDYSFSIATK